MSSRLCTTTENSNHKAALRQALESQRDQQHTEKTLLVEKIRSSEKTVLQQLADSRELTVQQKARHRRAERESTREKMDQQRREQEAQVMNTATKNAMKKDMSTGRKRSIDAALEFSRHQNMVSRQIVLAEMTQRKEQHTEELRNRISEMKVEKLTRKQALQTRLSSEFDRKRAHVTLQKREMKLLEEQRKVAINPLGEESTERHIFKSPSMTPRVPLSVRELTISARSDDNNKGGVAVNGQKFDKSEKGQLVPALFEQLLLKIEQRREAEKNTAIPHISEETIVPAVLTLEVSMPTVSAEPTSPASDSAHISNEWRSTLPAETPKSNNSSNEQFRRISIDSISSWKTLDASSPLMTQRPSVPLPSRPSR